MGLLPAERQPWFTSIAGEVVKEIVRPAVERASGTKPVEKLAIEPPSPVAVDMLLSWISQRTQFDGLQRVVAIENPRVLLALDEQIAWANALRVRLNHKVTHGVRCDRAAWHYVRFVSLTFPVW